MKKVFALAVTAGLALSLAACDWGSGNKTDAAPLNEQVSLNEGGMSNEDAGNDMIGEDAIGNTATNTTDGNAL